MASELGSSAGAGRPRARSRSQSGATLIEVLVVLGVMVPVVLAATLGMLVTVRASSAAKVSQELDAAAASYVESLKQTPYVPCADVDGYDSATELWTPPADSDISIDITVVEYWDQSAAAFDAATCPSGDDGAQLITIDLADSESSTTLSVTKRDPAGFPVAATP